MEVLRFCSYRAAACLGAFLVLVPGPSTGLPIARGEGDVRSLAELRSQLAEQRKQYVMEERPFRDHAQIDPPSATPADSLQRLAEAFDYRWDETDGIVHLHKRYSDIEDRPSFSAEELRAVADRLLPMILPHRVAWTGGMGPLTRFIRSFTPEQLAAMNGRSVPATSLPPQQRRLLDDFGADYFLGTAPSQMTALQALLARPGAVRLTLDPKELPAAGPQFLCRYEDPMRPNARLLIRLPPTGFRPKIPRPGHRAPPPIPVPLLTPSSRRIIHKVTIDRQDVTVDEIFDELQTQASIRVVAPTYCRDRRVSVVVRDVEAGRLLDAMGAVFGWQWDASTSRRVRIGRPSFTATSWTQMQPALWGTLPKPLRAYLETAPGRTSMLVRREDGALLAGRRLFEAVKDQLGDPRGVRYADLPTDVRQRFLDWLAYDLVGTAFEWEGHPVPPWLVHPEQTMLQASIGTSPNPSLGAAAAGATPTLSSGSGSMRIVGPGAFGESVEIGFSLASHPAFGGR